MLCLAGVVARPAEASEYISDPSESEHVPVVVRDYFLNKENARRAMEADLEFARNMARHHQGAVDMANAYLRDPRGVNPVVQRLARSIIHNQAFEIAVLDVVRRDVEAGPQRVASVGGRELLSLRRGVDGLEHEWFFIRAPQPTVVDLWLSPNLRVSEYDVQFARPMIHHHSAAVDMALRYNRDPHGRSSVLGPMNIGIIVDQRYEIDLMRRLIARYPGDPQSVPDDPQMMGLMQRSMSGMHGTDHGH
jgi:uncharacterized protein (DUF305 family)